MCLAAFKYHFTLRQRRVVFWGLGFTGGQVSLRRISLFLPKTETASLLADRNVLFASSIAKSDLDLHEPTTRGQTGQQHVHLNDPHVHAYRAQPADTMFGCNSAEKWENKSFPPADGSMDSVPELPALGEAGSEFDFDTEQLLTYVTTTKDGETPRWLRSCFGGGIRRGKATTRREHRGSIQLASIQLDSSILTLTHGSIQLLHQQIRQYYLAASMLGVTYRRGLICQYYLAASMLGVTYRRGLVMGDETYLVSIPLDRIASVDVSTTMMDGYCLTQATIAVSGDNTKLVVVGLKNPHHFQDAVQKLQCTLVKNLEALQMDVVPELVRAISNHRPIMMPPAKALEAVGDDNKSESAGSDVWEPGLDYIRQHLASIEESKKPSLAGPILGEYASSGGASSLNFSPLASFVTKNGVPKALGSSSKAVEDVGMAAYLFEPSTFESDQDDVAGGSCIVNSAILNKLKSNMAMDDGGSDIFINPLYSTKWVVDRSVDIGVLHRSGIKNGILKATHVGDELLCPSIEPPVVVQATGEGKGKLQPDSAAAYATGEQLAQELGKQHEAYGIVSVSSKGV
eukprot:gene11586-34288_t